MLKRSTENEMNQDIVIVSLISILYSAILFLTLILVVRSRFKSVLADIFCPLGGIAALGLPVFLMANSKPAMFDFLWSYSNQLFLIGLFGAPTIQFLAAFLRSLERQNFELAKLNWALAGLSVITPIIVFGIMVAVGYGDGA